MLIEKEVEGKIITALQGLTQLSAMQIVGARQEASSGMVKGEVESDRSGVIAVSVGYRTHDSFSLTPITLPVAVVITTRAEMDATGALHEQALEAVTNLLSYWHRYGDVMTLALSTDGFFAGELRLDGGNGKKFDQTRSSWVEPISFAIRGAEKFNEG